VDKSDNGLSLSVLLPGHGFLVPLFAVAEATGYSDRLTGVQVTIYDVPTWNAADWQVVE
jgi:hypothetical protein